MAADKPLVKYPRWLWVIVDFTLVITTLPYILGFEAQGDTWQFTGFVFGVEDGNSYIAKMMRGAAGEWLFQTPYTAQPQAGVLAFLPYLLLGKLSAPPGQHEQLVVLFHLFRVVAGCLSILATYEFLAHFISGERWRRWAVVLIAWGGGLGWSLILVGRSSWLGSLPLEFYSPETFGFLAIYGLPHLAMARALMFWGLRGYLFPETAPASINGGIFAGLLWLLMGLLQPLTVVLAWVVIAAYLAVLLIRILRSGDDLGFERTNLKSIWLRSVYAGMVSAPIVLYTFWRFNTDPFLRQWTTQNQILSPHPLHYLLAYGLLIPFAVPWFQCLWKEDAGQPWLLAAWTLIIPILLYVPYPLQRRLAEGFWVVLVILSVSAIERSQALQKFHRVFFLLFPSTVILIVGGFQQVLNPALPLFRPVAEIEAFDYLSQNAGNEDVVLASYETSNALPAWAANYVLIGHGPESVGLAELQPQLERFFSQGMTDSERLDLIAVYGVDYVFWGPSERHLGDWNPQEADFLDLQFSQSGYSIYRVTIADRE